MIATARPRRGPFADIFRPAYAGDPVMRENVAASMADGMLYSAMIGLTSPFLAVCALSLGASDYMVGLVTTLPAVVALLSQVPGAAISERHPSLLRTVLVYAFLHRMWFLALAAIPLLPWSPIARAWAYIAALAVMNAPATVCGVAWTAMIGQIYPPVLRGRIFGERNMMCQLTTVAATLAGGWLVDTMPHPYNWTALFGVSFLCVMGSLYYLTRMRVPVRPLPAARRLATLREVLGQGPFVQYTAGAFIYHLGLNLPAPVFTILFVRHLGLSAQWIGLLSVAAGVTIVLTSRRWGRLADVAGSRRALLLSMAGLMALPLGFAAARNAWFLLPLQVLGGVSVAGFNIAVFNLLLERSPEDKRPTYIAVFNSLMMSTGFAPLAGVALYARWGLWGALGAASALRLCGWLWIVRFLR